MIESQLPGDGLSIKESNLLSVVVGPLRLPYMPVSIAAGRPLEGPRLGEGMLRCVCHNLQCLAGFFFLHKASKSFVKDV